MKRRIGARRTRGFSFGKFFKCFLLGGPVWPVLLSSHELRAWERNPNSIPASRRSLTAQLNELGPAGRASHQARPIRKKPTGESLATFWERLHRWACELP